MRLRLALVIALAWSWIVPASASAELFQAYSTVVSETIAPGVTHEAGTAAASAGNQQIHVLSVDPASPDLHFETSLPYDRASARERVTDQALRQSSDGNRVIGAVNANLWQTWGDWTLGNLAYAPIGLTIADGEIVTAGFGATPAFGVSAEGAPLIGSPTQGVQVGFPDGTVRWINHVNHNRTPQELTLYTPRFETHTWTDANGVEVVLETGGAALRPNGLLDTTVVEVRPDLGDTPIGPTQFVLSAWGNPEEWLRVLVPGDTVTIRTFIDAEWANVEEAIGGAEVLVRDGVADSYSPRRPDAVLRPHPRTAIGVRDDGRVLVVTIDGRSSISKGLTNAEVTELMLSLGAVDVVNLDGGGSTTMAVRRPGDVEASVVNRPSDGVERTVSASLQIVSTIPTGEMTDVVVSTGVDNVYLDETHQLTAKGHDAHYNGIVLDQTLAAWSAEGDAATVTSDGVLNAVGLGPVHIGLTYGPAGEFSTNRTIEILRDGQPPIVTPPTAVLAADVTSGKTTTGLTVSWAATDVAGVVTSMSLQRSMNGGPFRAITLPTPLTTSIRVTATFGSTYQFRVRALDDSLNRSSWTYGPVYRVDSVEAPSAAFVATGNWVTKASTKAIANAFGRSDARTQPQPSATGSYVGFQAALVGVRAPKAGLATMVLDGNEVGSVDLYRSTKQMRSVIFRTSITDVDQPTLQHTVEVRNVSGADRPFVDLDALLVLSVELPQEEPPPA